MYLHYFITTFVISILLGRLKEVDAKCCNKLGGGFCGDYSNGTPCCGYEKCNGFCCACGGFNGVVTQTSPHYTPTVTQTLTVPPGVTWTCRALHPTTPARDDNVRPTGLITQPIPQPTAFADLETHAIFYGASPEGEPIDLDLYLQIMQVNQTDPFRETWVDKFYRHDLTETSCSAWRK